MPRNKAVILIIAAIISAVLLGACVHADEQISQRAGMERAIANGVSGVCLLEENYRENTVSVGLSRKSDIPGLPQTLFSI